MERIEGGATWGFVAGRGAAIGAELVLAYSAAFGIYALVRSSLFILGAADAGQGWGVLAASAVSLAWTVVVMGALMAVVAAAIGLVTALAVKGLLAVLNPGRSPGLAATIGLLVAAALWLLLRAALPAPIRLALSPAYPETLLFWYVLPGLVYVIAAAVYSRRLNSLGRS